MNLLICVIGLLFMEFILFLLLFKFVLSDFFHDKTGIRTFYIKDGKKKCTDNVNLILSMLYLILVLMSLGMGLYYFLGENVASLGLFLYSILFLYLSVCLFVRINYFPFEDEKIIENRIHPFTYTSISIRHILVTTIFTTLFAMFYLVLGIGNSLLCSMISLIYGHVVSLVPDYLNNYWYTELRSQKGMYSFYLLNFIVMVPLIYILISSM